MTRPPKKSSILTWLPVFGGVCLLLFAGYFFLNARLPGQIKKTAADALQKALGPKVAFDRLALMRKFGITLVLDHVKIEGPAGGEPVLEAPRAEVRINLSELLSLRLKFSEIRFIDPLIRVRRTDAGAWNVSRLRESVPVFRPGIRKPAAESVVFQNARLIYSDASREPVFSATGTSELMTLTPGVDHQSWSMNGDLNLSRGAYLMPVTFEVQFQGADDSLLLTVRGSAVAWTLKALVSAISSDPQFRGELELSTDQVERLFLRTAPWAPAFRGELTASLEFQGEGTHPAFVRKGLNFYGSLEIRDGRMKGFNLLRQLFRQLNPRTDPDASGTGETAELLNAEDLVFERLTCNLERGDGFVDWDEIMIQHAQYLLMAQGGYSEGNNTADFGGKLILLEPLTNLLVKRNPELTRYVRGGNRTVMDFRCRGLMPHATLTLSFKGPEIESPVAADSEFPIDEEARDDL